MRDDCEADSMGNGIVDNGFPLRSSEVTPGKFSKGAGHESYSVCTMFMRPCVHPAVERDMTYTIVYRWLKSSETMHEHFGQTGRDKDVLEKFINRVD